MSARYLLRFDDICPGMNWPVWNEVEAVLSSEGIKPILAVIPENVDPALEVSPHCSDFWSRVREWQTRKWTIGVHGWQHRYVTQDSGILRVNNYSEFAGLPRSEQELKLRSGRDRFIDEGIDFKLWIAPAHSFDRLTVQLLHDLGYQYISDGYFYFPHVDELGITWIPQQLWAFKWRPFGIWTICFHINSWTEQDLENFRRCVRQYRNRISSFETVIEAFGKRRKSVIDTASACTYRSLASVSRALKQLA